MLSYTVDAKF